MLKKFRLIWFVSSTMVMLTGCATLSPEGAFLDVADTVAERTGKQIVWDTASDYDIDARSALRGLLSRTLTSESAVQFALLNNRALQAAYAELGIAQADLVQAGLLSNPIFDGAVVWTEGIGTPNFTFGLAYKFIELLWNRLRRQVAGSRLEEAKIRVSGLVIDHAARTHLAFVDYVSARQETELFSQVVRSARATLTAAKALREAGNITALQFEQNQSVVTQAKLDLANAQVRAAAAREKLNVLMGLTGQDTEWRAPVRLPEIPEGELRTDNAESRAIKASLELAELHQQLISLGLKYRLTNKQILIPDLEIGGEFEREVEEVETEGGGTETEITKKYGPTLELALPIFDRGEAKRARGIMEIRQAQDRYWAMGVRVRSAARLSRAGLLTARKKAAYFIEVILPQRQKILTETQRQYNAMQEDVFKLIVAKREQMQAGQQYIGALQDYWSARVRFQQIMRGRLPAGMGGG